MPRPTAFFSPVVRAYRSGHVVPGHSHPWPQLLYAASGAVGVETARGSWVVAPQRAVKIVASTLGYTPSAFSVMLRRVTGTTPQSLRQSFARQGELALLPRH